MQRLEKLKNELFSLHNAQLVVTCDEAMHQKLELENYFGVLDLPERPFNPWKGGYELYPVVSQGRSMSTPVAFTCEAYPVPLPESPRSGTDCSGPIFWIIKFYIRRSGSKAALTAAERPISDDGSFYALFVPGSKIARH